ncbi:MAG: FAD-binding oxidoreductase [Actinobacteria bacterium]|nr:FAD-binding oxidoreductase [Actinomycetota bacterium]
MARDQDTIIVGAGVIGTAIALELARRGRRPLCLDKLPAAGYGATGNSSTIARSYYSSRDGVALACEGYGHWSDWGGYLGVADERGLARFVQCGSLLLKARDGHHEKVVDCYGELGVEYEELDADEVGRRLPILDLGEFWPPCLPADPAFREPPEGRIEGAILDPGAGYLDDPQLVAHNLQVAAEAAGARFEFRQEVVAVNRAGDRVAGVTLADGRRLDAAVVVNAAGPWSGPVNAMAGVLEEMNVGTRPLRQEVHHVPAPAGFDFEREGCVISDGDQGIYFRPTTANHILVGSEDPECDPRTWVEDPADFDRHVTEAVWEAQVYRLARRLPGLRIPNARLGVVDVYDVSDDWLPIYDRSSLGGFYMAIGTSGHQFKAAPVVGGLIAELVERVEGGQDHDTDPVRVAGRYTGFELSLAPYSRLREINRRSSFSVRG